MRQVRVVRVAMAVLLSASIVALPGSVRATGTAPTPGPCRDSTLPGGALAKICIPSSGWNGDLVVWAHGYVDVTQPITFANLNLPGGLYLPTLVQSLGFAFATTSYRKNGLAVLEGVDDVVELVGAFHSTAHRRPGHTYMVGASEGGLITTLLIERHPDLFSGGLAACGPIGDFRSQIDYWGDFDVLFNYFFPNVVPTDPISVPPQVMANWETTYKPAIQDAERANPDATRQLMRTSKAPLDPARPDTTAISSTFDIMWYNVFATNDGIRELGGHPYSNTRRWYWGSSDDWRLNRQVARFAADPAALTAMANYQTSGHLTLPLVTLHTTGDDVIPYWHEILYARKVHTSGRGTFLPLTVFAYGHCNFTPGQMLGAFALLVYETTHRDVPGMNQTWTQTTGEMAGIRTP